MAQSTAEIIGSHPQTGMGGGKSRQRIVGLRNRGTRKLCTRLALPMAQPTVARSAIVGSRAMWAVAAAHLLARHCRLQPPQPRLLLAHGQDDQLASLLPLLLPPPAQPGAAKGCKRLLGLLLRAGGLAALQRHGCAAEHWPVRSGWRSGGGGKHEHPAESHTDSASPARANCDLGECSANSEIGGLPHRFWQAAASRRRPAGMVFGWSGWRLAAAWRACSANIAAEYVVAHSSRCSCQVCWLSALSTSRVIGQQRR